MFLPRPLAGLGAKVMERTDTGMQLEVWLQPGAGPPGSPRHQERNHQQHCPRARQSQNREPETGPGEGGSSAGAAAGEGLTESLSELGVRFGAGGAEAVGDAIDLLGLGAVDEGAELG